MDIPEDEKQLIEVICPECGAKKEVPMWFLLDESVYCDVCNAPITT